MDLFSAIILLLLLVFGSSLNWKLSVKTVLVLVVIEGALRRWAFPQARELIYFFRDFILIGAYLSFFSRSPPLVDRYPSIKLLTIVATVLCFLQALNPSLGSFIVGIFGLRAYLLYIPLVWVVPHLFDSGDDLRNFLRNYLLLIIPVCTLGIVQYFSPADSPLNVYAPDLSAATASVGEFIRITGTFSYLAGMTVFLSVCFSLLIVFVSLERTLIWKIVYALLLSLVVINSFMTGSRGLILYEVLFLIGYCLLLLFNQPKAFFSFAGRLLISGVLATIIALNYFPQSIDAFVGRATGSGDSVGDRIAGSFTQVFDYGAMGSIGYGTGATQPGASALRQVFKLPPGAPLPPSEGETGRVFIELGIAGFLVWYGLRIVLLLSLFSVFLRLKKPFYQRLAIAIFLFQSINMTGQLVTNPTMMAYFWFFSGFIYLLPILEAKDSNEYSFPERRNRFLRPVHPIPHSPYSDS
jgi:hypothetical protein